MRDHACGRTQYNGGAVLLCGGGPHLDLSEVPVPFVVARDGKALHPPDLLPFVAQRLPRIYRPDIRLVAGLPETSVGKVDRRAVRDTFLAD